MSGVMVTLYLIESTLMKTNKEGISHLDAAITTSHRLIDVEGQKLEPSHLLCFCNPSEASGVLAVDIPLVFN